MMLEAGLSGHQELVVTERELASFVGNLGVHVLSTHHVVLLMEKAARHAIEACIPEGKTTLGTRIDIRHLAAAPLGSKVRAEAVLKSVEGNRFTFHVAAYDEFEILAEGENEQILVRSAQFENKMRSKTAKQGLLQGVKS